MWSALWLWDSGTGNCTEEEDMSSGTAASTRTERISLYVSVAAATVGICTFAWYRSCYPLCSRNDPAAEHAGDKP